jgi:uncharacterized protein (TIGR02300 family)
MAKEEWGVKRACPSCGVRFYDLAADPVICPACESSFPLAALNERKPGAAVAESKPKPKKAAPAKKFVEESDDDDLVVDDDDDDDDLNIEDEVLIDEDDDDDDDSLAEIGDVKPKGEDES